MTHPNDSPQHLYLGVRRCVLFFVLTPPLMLKQILKKYYRHTPHATPSPCPSFNSLALGRKMFATQLALIISSTSLALFYITSGWGRILNVVFLILAGFASGGTSGTTLSSPPLSTSLSLRFLSPSFRGHRWGGAPS